MFKARNGSPLERGIGVCLNNPKKDPPLLHHYLSRPLQGGEFCAPDKCRIGFLFLLLFFWGCASHDKNVNISVSLIDSNRSLKITGFDKMVINDIGRDSDSDSEAWQALLPVYKMPADTDLKDYQPVQPGKYKIADSVVVFTPDTAFKKGQAYFLRYFQYGDINDAWQFIRERKRPGSLKYKDLLFRY
jgi:hypothetical protein